MNKIHSEPRLGGAVEKNRRSLNLFAICITALAIAFGSFARDYVVEREKGEHVRNLLRLQQAAESYLRPSIEIRPDAKLDNL